LPPILKLKELCISLVDFPSLLISYFCALDSQIKVTQQLENIPIGKAQIRTRTAKFILFDVIDPESPLAEDWAILETYLGAEVLLTPLSEWQRLVRQAGGKIVKTSSGELFQSWQVSIS